MRYGQCTMNYEAMGRYAEAKLRIERLVAERRNDVNYMQNILARTAPGLDATIPRIDVVGLDMHVKRLVEIEAELLSAVSDANAVAEECQQPRIVMVDGNGQ